MKILAICFFLCWSMLTGLHAQTKFDYYYMEAEKCRLVGDYASAAELYQHCLDIRPDAPDAIYSLALIQFYLRSILLLKHFLVLNIQYVNLYLFQLNFFQAIQNCF